MHNKGELEVDVEEGREENEENRRRGEQKKCVNIRSNAPFDFTVLHIYKRSPS